MTSAIIICSASNSAPITHDAEPLRNETGASYTSQSNTTGWPASDVRGGTAEKDNLPLGIHVVVPPWRDDVILAALAFIESKTGGYVKPTVVCCTHFATPSPLSPPSSGGTPLPPPRPIQSKRPPSRACRPPISAAKSRLSRSSPPTSNASPPTTNAAYASTRLSI